MGSVEVAASEVGAAPDIRHASGACRSEWRLVRVSGAHWNEWEGVKIPSHFLLLAGFPGPDRVPVRSLPCAHRCSGSVPPARLDRSCNLFRRCVRPTLSPFAGCGRNDALRRGSGAREGSDLTACLRSDGLGRSRDSFPGQRCTAEALEPDPVDTGVGKRGRGCVIPPSSSLRSRRKGAYRDRAC